MNTNNNSGRIGFGGILFIVFLVLKLTGNIDWRDVLARVRAEVGSRVRAVRLPRRSSRGGLQFDPTVRIDPTVIDGERWLAWGEANLSTVDFERMQRAVEADRASQRVATG